MKKLKAHYLFGKTSIPLDISDEIDRELVDLRKYASREAYLKAAYDLVTTRYEAGRMGTITRFFELFSESIEDLWNRSGFVHCTNQNYLIALLLIKGGNFNVSDIKRTWTLIWYCSPHQYLKVRVSDDKWVIVDCWARHYGVQFGDYAHGFNTTAFRSFAK